MVDYNDSLTLTRMEAETMAKAYRMTPEDCYEAGFNAAEEQYKKKIFKLKKYKNEKRKEYVEAVMNRMRGIAIIILGIILAFIFGIGEFMIICGFLGFAFIKDTL